jgi:pSer/pThr/pTyr-binding forkhead associated (FHA) protein
MVSPDGNRHAGVPTGSITGFVSSSSIDDAISQPGMVGSAPVLTLSNDSLNIRIVGMNGAIIGRRQGPYTQFFANQGYVSGVHAQLKYLPKVGWCVVDKHSSNGTKLNQRQVQPDVDMTLKNGDILTLANVNLQVNIR